VSKGKQGKASESKGDPAAGGVSRREVISVLAAGSGLGRLRTGWAQGRRVPSGRVSSAEQPRGTPTDPDLIRPRVWWEKRLTTAELATLSALCDTIIPADDRSPSASAVGVPDYIDEWASAPYDSHREALIRIRGGLVWLEGQARSRFQRGFAQLSDAERRQICDEICYRPEARAELQAYAAFFDLIRDLSATGFYTTREGMRDLGYVGNVPLPRFEGPPPEVRRHLGLE
jgi:hypothetical protein